MAIGIFDRIRELPGLLGFGRDEEDEEEKRRREEEERRKIERERRRQAQEPERPGILEQASRRTKKISSGLGRDLASGIEVASDIGIRELDKAEEAVKTIGRTKPVQKAFEAVKRYNKRSDEVEEVIFGKPVASEPGEEPIVRPADWSREVSEIVKQTPKLAVSVLQGTARTGASIAQTLIGPVGDHIGQDFRDIEFTGDDPEDKIARILFGEDIFGEQRIGALETNIAKGEVEIKSFAREQRAQAIAEDPDKAPPLTLDILEQGALPISALAVAGITTLDFTGLGGQDDVIKAIAKTADTGTIAKMLRTMGAAEDLILPFADRLSKITSKADVKRGLDALNDAMQQTRPATEAAGFPAGRGVSADRLLGREAPQRVIKDEAQLLRERMALLQRGSREGIQRGRAETRKRVASEWRARMKTKLEQQRIRGKERLETMRLRRDEIEAFRKEATEYAQKNLPPVERGKLVRALKNVKTAKDRDRIIVRAGELAEEASQRDLRQAITSTANSTQPKVVSGRAVGRTTPEAEQVLAPMRENINRGQQIRKELREQGLRGTELSRKARDIELREYEEAQQQIAANIDLLQNPDALAKSGRTEAEIMQENDILRTVGIKFQNTDQLSPIIDNLNAVKTEGRTISELRAGNKAAQRQRTVDGAATELASRRDMVEARERKADNFAQGLIRALDDGTNWIHSMRTLAEKVSQSAGQKFKGPINTIAKQMDEARFNYFQSTRVVTKHIQDNFDRIYGVSKKWERAKVVKRNQEEFILGKFTFREPGKAPVEKDLVMTQNQAYKHWMQFRDPTTAPMYREMGWTDEIKEAVENFITPETKEWARWQQEEFFPSYWKSINVVYEKRFGVTMPRNPNYAGQLHHTDIISDNTTASGILQSDFRRTVSTRPGSLKLRTSKTAKIDPHVDGDQSLMSYVMQMEHFKAFDETVSDLRHVFNHADVTAGLTKSERKAFNKIIDNVAADGRDLKNAVAAVDKMRGNFYRATLGLNPTILVKQLVSTPLNIIAMPGNPNTKIPRFFKGVAEFWKDPTGNWKLLHDSEYLKARYNMDAIDRDLRLAMEHNPAKSLSGHSSWKDYIMTMMKLGDKTAIIQGGYPVYKANYDEFIKQGMRHEEAHRLALGKFDEATSALQQSGLPENLSPIQTTGGSYAKLFSMFLNQPQQLLRQVDVAARGLKKGRGTTAENLQDIAIAWGLNAFLFQLISDGGEFRKERQLRALIAGPLNGIPLAGQVIDDMARALTGDDRFGGTGAPAVFSPLKLIGNALSTGRKALFDPEEEVSIEDYFKLTEQLAEGIGSVRGVPVGPVLGMATGAKDLITGETNDLRRLIFSPYALDQEESTPLLDFSSERREIRELKKKDKERREEKKEMKSAMVEKVKNMSDAETAMFLGDLVRDKTISIREARAVVDEAKAPDLNEIEKEIVGKSVELRSEWMLRRMREMRTPQERKEFLLKMRENGIFTKGTADIMKEESRDLLFL